MIDINDIKNNDEHLKWVVDNFLKVKQLHMKIATTIMSCVDLKTMQESAKTTDFTACLDLINEAENILDYTLKNINRMAWGKDWLNLQREYYRLCKTNDVLAKKIKTIIKNQQFARLNDVAGIRVMSTFFKSSIDIKQFAHVFTAGAEQNAIAAAAREREAEHIRKQFGFYQYCGYGYPTNKFEYNDPNILYFGTETLHNDQITKWIQSVLHDNPKNYDEQSILNHRLDELRYEAARKKMFER